MLLLAILFGSTSSSNPEPVIQHPKPPIHRTVDQLPTPSWYFIYEPIGVFRMVDRPNCELMKQNYPQGKCIKTSMVRT
jgi:hypothetical protein